MQNENLNEMIKISQDKTVVVDGPLSAQYTKILNTLYKKEVDQETGISLETQALDDFYSKSIWVATKSRRDQLESAGASTGLLYGVKASDVGVSTIVEVTDALSDMNDDQISNSAIIIEKDDLTPSGFTDSVTNLADDYGVNVFASLEAYIESVVLKNGKYPGTISGNKVTFKIEGKVQKFTNSTGVRGKNIPCIVVVKNNDVYEINIDQPKEA